MSLAWLVVYLRSANHPTISQAIQSGWLGVIMKGRQSKGGLATQNLI